MDNVHYVVQEIIDPPPPTPSDGGHICFRPLHPLEFAFQGFLVRTPHPQAFS